MQQMSVSVSDVTLNMMKKRILFKKENGEHETPLDAYKRVAKFVATGHRVFTDDKEAKKFEEKTIEMMGEGKFMPNTPIIVNAGFSNAQCSACFILPTEDTLQSIYQTHYNQGVIQASGGGTGIYLGNIRSAGTKASHDRFVTKGPISWLKMFNENASHVVQGMRDGANMAMLNIGHPDIVDFITCKNSGYKLIDEELAEQFEVSLEEAKRIKSIIGIEKFNTSVSITDKFMNAVENDEDWYLVDPHTKKRVKNIKAKELWDLIVKNAHQHGEPGVFFVDTANRYNMLSNIAKMECTNPCGEISGIPNTSCTLGHVNLSKFVIENNVASKINWDGLEDAVRFGTQFLDDVVEVNHLPTPQLVEMNKNSRQIGLGIMGWADTLIKLSTAYDSDLAIAKANEIGKFIDGISMDECQRLGKDRGNYPYFDGSPMQKSGVKHMRCANRTTIAPTGQTSMYVGCSSGIEPIMFPIMRREQAGMVQVDYHPILMQTLKDRGLDTQEIKDKLGILGSVRKAEFLPEDIRNLFPSAHDIDYTWHVKHQATWQRHITSAVSKTINLPKDAPVDDVSNAYLLAFKSGCKGITVYRDGSRTGQPLSSMKETKKLVKSKNKRSEVTHGTNRKIPCGCGNIMAFIGGQDGKVEEIIARLGRGGSCSSAQVEAISRMASIAMQHGANPEYVAKQLGSIRCHLNVLYKSKYTGDRPRTITSCSDAMSVALSEHMLNGTGNKLEKVDAMAYHAGACPDCGGQVAYEEGCIKCYSPSCGYSRCG